MPVFEVEKTAMPFIEDLLVLLGESEGCFVGYIDCCNITFYY